MVKFLIKVNKIQYKIEDSISDTGFIFLYHINVTCQWLICSSQDYIYINTFIFIFTRKYLW